MDVGSIEVWVVGLAAIATSALSAVAGLGGGMILLAVIAQFFAPTVAIPVHAGIQLASNSSRAVRLRDEVSWPAVGWSTLTLLPFIFVGALIATWVPEDATRLALGVFLLVLVWRPQWLRFNPNEGLTNRGLMGVGAVSGLLNSTVGAAGPFTSPFFKAVTAGHIAFVATAATSQTIAHSSKLLAFGSIDLFTSDSEGFVLGDHLPVMGAGAVGAVVGTLIGARLLGSADEKLLGRIFRTVLTVLAVRLVYLSLG